MKSSRPTNRERDMFSICYNFVCKVSWLGRPEIDACIHYIHAAQLEVKVQIVHARANWTWTLGTDHDRLGYRLTEQRRFLGDKDVYSEKKRPTVSQRLSAGLSLVGLKQYPSHQIMCHLIIMWPCALLHTHKIMFKFTEFCLDLLPH